MNSHTSQRLGESPGNAPELRPVQPRLRQNLLGPAGELFMRPHKQVRAELVRLGFLLSGEHHEKGDFTTAEADALDCLGEVLEAVHAGSLVVDDIQDDSPLRRGEPSLHCLMGVPLAINLGNWLYFKPLEWIRELNLPPAKELALYRIYHETLTRAHMGQALDLGTPIAEVEQQDVRSLCLTAMHLKTGALMALALQMGALLGDASVSRLEILAHWGQRFGVGLQMCNDLQALKPGPERFHDLALGRPTFVWALVAQHCDAEAYASWQQAVAELPNPDKLEDWLKKQDFLALACRESRDYLNTCFERLQSELQAPSTAFNQSYALIEHMIKRICHAYI